MFLRFNAGSKDSCEYLELPLPRDAAACYYVAWQALVGRDEGFGVGRSIGGDAVI